MVADIVENAKETAERIKFLEELEKAIKEKIETIEQPYQNALYTKYINNKTIAETSVKLDYSYQQTIRILKKANKLYENIKDDTKCY